MNCIYYSFEMFPAQLKILKSKHWMNKIILFKNIE